MSITWKTIDAWREKREMQVSDLARRAGIPERTIYAGVASDAKLRASTVSVMRQVFPDEFREAAE
jgi:predicted transcriptional regulator